MFGINQKFLENTFENSQKKDCTYLAVAWVYF